MQLTNFLCYKQLVRKVTDLLGVLCKGECILDKPRRNLSYPDSFYGRLPVPNLIAICYADLHTQLPKYIILMHFVQRTENNSFNKLGDIIRFLQKHGVN
jgi:peptidoglycan/xylan/chitin deacetylase (PgdA/CDA1 family)